VRFTFAQPASFAAEWRRLDLTDEDLQSLEGQIIDRPEVGPLMRGTGGIRKMRFSPPSWRRGKSGALRVCYVIFHEARTVYLLLVFPKNEKANLSPSECEYFRKQVAALRSRAAGA
jgi:hypothetical protein